ncbi:hypothetical protein [Algiphilus sp.]|uniref:hypothetical protein n=1 Tax=Algiphilus sp. TaxID=1872431 RepID=UPI003B526390
MSHPPTTARRSAKPVKPVNVAMPEFLAPAMPPMELFAWLGRTARAYWRRHRTERLLRAQPQLRDDIAGSNAMPKRVDEAQAPPRP